MKHRAFLLAGFCLTLLSCRTSSGGTSSLGIFEGERDIGQTGQPGSARFEPASGNYTVTGGGENMWFTNDAFHFVWKRVSGDTTLAANFTWPQPGGNAHRKACLMLRQSLDPDSAYADAVVHGDGLCSLQCRETPGAPTREIQSNVSQPARLRIEKQGDVLSMSVAPEGQALDSAGGSFRIRFQEPFYVGLAVCAHDNRVAETAVFSEVDLAPTARPSGTNFVLESTLETVAIGSKDRRVVYHTRGHFEAPNWSRDGRYFLFNSQGHIYRLDRQGGTPQLLDTGLANRCNNDHGLSPDGTRLAISHHGPGGKSLIYIVPVTGGAPTQITPLGPSYWHGWSPDGETLAYCAERNANFDVYTIPVGGGEERRLTSAPGLDDGPEYSPDGQFIYFNSERTGRMKIWRMRADGTQQQPVTSNDYNDWFPHPSPDGKWLVFLSYANDVQGHPANQTVLLRLRPIAGGEIQTVARLFGGQGTINVPSWSPDSKQFAFVSYRLQPSP